MIGGEGCSKEYVRINDTDRAKERIYAGTVQTGVAVGLPPRSERRRVRFPVSAPNNRLAPCRETARRLYSGVASA